MLIDERPRQLMEAGPTNRDVLHLQPYHRSTVIWDTQEEKILTCRRNDRRLHRVHQAQDLRVLRYLNQAGFYGWYRLGFIELDWALVTALVERWRVETHTFHLPVGESTITLQDVAILSGLPVDGDPVTGVDKTRKPQGWKELCLELLGLIPPDDKLKGGRLSLSWLASNFSALPDGASDEKVQYHTRACLLMMIGGHLLSDKSQGLVKLLFLPLLRDFGACGRLSWGAAALACLYRHMCEATKADVSDIGGPLIMLQLWAWERLSHIQPRRLSTTLHRPQPVPDSMMVGDNNCDEAKDMQLEHDPLPTGPYGCRWHAHLAHGSTIAHSLRHYRDHIDQMKDEQMIWQPYTFDVLKQLPAYCLVGNEIWQTLAPLICFDVVELHLPDRVLRQFGMRQPIPQTCDTKNELHATDRRGRPNYDWEAVHVSYIREWRERRSHVVQGEPFQGRMEYGDPYMQWYRSITRLLILPPTRVPSVGFQPVAGVRALLVDSLARVHQISVDTLGAYDADQGIGALERIREICQNAFSGIGEEQHLAYRPSLPSETPTHSPPPMLIRPRGVVRQRTGRRARMGERGDRTTATDRVPNDSSTPFPNDTATPLPNESSPPLLDVHPSISSAASRLVETLIPDGTLTTSQTTKPVLLVGESLLDGAIGHSEEHLESTITQLEHVEDTSLLASHTTLPARGSLDNQSQTQTPPQIPISWPHDSILTQSWVISLMDAFDWGSRNLPPSDFPSLFPIQVFDSLVLSASKILHKEPNCVKIDGFDADSSVVVVGDVHGQLHDVIFLLRDAGYPMDNRFFVFNGDYVDRGAWGLETFLLLLAWKVCMPRKVYLLRGSHESKFCTSVYGFEKEVLTKYGDKGKHVYQECLGCFEGLPLASIIGGCVYIAHGGLFRSVATTPLRRYKRKKTRKIILNPEASSLVLGSLEDLFKARRTVLDPPSKGLNLIPRDVLWSDPSMSPGLFANKEQGFGLLWGPDCTEEFLKKSNLKLIIRSHEGPDAREKRSGLGGMNKGYAIDHVVESGKLITLFSAPDYPQFQTTEERYKNKGAYIVLEPPHFDSPVFHSFEAITPRPKANPYYDYEDVINHDEERDLASVVS